MESRSAEGRCEQLPVLAEDLVRLTPDVIVTRAAAAAVAAKKGYMVTGVDPVAEGRRAGWGGN